MSSALLPFSELWPLIADEIEPLPAEVISLHDSNRRVLRKSARAVWDLPRADNSAMDGFAVCSGGGDGSPSETLTLLNGDAYAGSIQSVVVEPGTALPIATGGLVPPGANAVLPKENATIVGPVLKVSKAALPGDHIRVKGEELRTGDVVYEKGLCIDPLAIAAMMTAGITKVEVNRRPVIRIVTSGNEVVPAGSTARPGQVIDSNGPFLSAAIANLLGGVPSQPMQVRDDFEELVGVLGDALEDADVLLLSGGVSVGDRDLIKPVLEERLGVRRLVWRVAQKPGKPLYIGRLGTKWIIGLPGNPGAVVAMWTVVVRPLILALIGAKEPEPVRLSVRLCQSIWPNRTRTHLRWCSSSWKDGELWAEPMERSGSHMLSDLALADILLVVPPGDEALPAGTRLGAVRLDR